MSEFSDIAVLLYITPTYCIALVIRFKLWYGVEDYWAVDFGRLVIEIGAAFHQQ